MAIIQYSSLDKFSYSITEQGTSSYKSSEIQLPKGRPRTPYLGSLLQSLGFSPLLIRLWKSSTTTMIAITMSLVASLMHIHTQIPKKLPDGSCCNYYLVVTIFSINTHEEEQGLWSIQLSPASPTQHTSSYQLNLQPHSCVKTTAAF